MVRGLVSLVVVALAAVALLVFAPGVVDRVLPVAMVERLEGLRSSIAPGTAEPRTGNTAAAFLADRPEGLIATGPIAAMKGNVPVFISDAISGHSAPDAQDIPAEITTIRPIMGCLLTPPLGGTVVGHAVAGQSLQPIGIATYNDADLAAGVQAFADAYRAADAANATDPVEATVPDRLAYQSYDVVVTEVSAPVYLVLQTGQGNRIWNIHAAPGAMIERVVLLGGDQIGVANLDPVVPVEVIQNAGLDACGIRPAHALNPGHATVAAARSGTPAGSAATLIAHETAVDAYGLWFRDTFGAQAAPTRAGFDLGAVSVIGPLPGPEDAKAKFTPIAGSKIRTTQDSFFEIAGQVPPGEDFAARVTAITTSFAFGDLANLRQGADF
jgi:hypothetical protein